MGNPIERQPCPRLPLSTYLSPGVSSPAACVAPVGALGGGLLGAVGCTTPLEFGAETGGFALTGGVVGCATPLEGLALTGLEAVIPPPLVTPEGMALRLLFHTIEPLNKDKSG